MKNSILSMALIALIAFSCNKDEIADAPEQSQSQKNQAKMIQFLKSDQFKDYMITKNKKSNDQSQIAGRDSDNGLMMLQSPWGIGVGSFNFETWESTFIGGDDGSIEALPNGRAKFSVHTNNPWASHSSDIFLSSDCIDGPRGTFNFSIISDYTVDVFDFGEFGIFTFYSWTGENSSATSINGHCKVSDSGPVYNEDYSELLEACSGATVNKTIRIKGNQKNGFKVIVE